MRLKDPVDSKTTIQHSIRNGGTELLCPAGDVSRLKASVDFGADAVYLAGQEFGMRTSSKNFAEELPQAVAYAHERGVKVYLTCNTLPRNEELPRLPDALRFAAQSGVDAFIISDVGVLALAKQVAPQVSLHVSTQAGVVNYLTARAFYEMGASRVVLARELSLTEIQEIRANTPQELELEAFVHGAMCMSVSGRCLLSNYLTGRDANRGDCAQPCRWRYALMEEKRPGQYFPVEEQENGSYILNARDLCLIDHLPALSKAGVTSFKIEGRAKSAYYAAVTAYAYRQAIDFYAAHPDGEPLPDWIRQEVHKVSHREYSTGFLFGTPGQELETGGYVRDYEVIAVAMGWEKGRVLLEQRNRFFEGDEADCLCPSERPYLLRLNDLRDLDGNPVEVAPHPKMRLSAACERPVAKGTLLRKRTKE